MSSTRHITIPFTYHRPETLDETLRLLREQDLSLIHISEPTRPY